MPADNHLACTRLTLVEHLMFVSDLVSLHLFVFSQQLPFGSKGEFKEYLKEYVQKVRQELKSAGTPVEEIKK